MNNTNIKIVYIPISELKFAEYNPKKISEDALKGLMTSLSKFGTVDPLLVNSAPNRKGVVIGGNQRLMALRKMGQTEVPVVFLNIPDLGREKELNLRLSKNVGEFNWDLLAKFDEAFLSDVGFSSEDLDDIFQIDETPEEFNLERELQKLNIQKIEIQKGDVWQLEEHRLMCGDSTTEADILKLMGTEKANMCFTDPPYLLNYLKGKKKHGKATEGFGLKRDRKYLETDSLPDNFTDLWMSNIARVQKPDFSIIVFENSKNLRTIWNDLEKHWTYRNTIVWFLPNRMQGFAARYKFFNKYDFAMVGTSGQVQFNDESETNPLLQETYETALFATSGKPTWESYKKGKKYCPTDHITFVAADKKSSGQGIIFGTKPLEVLIPYLKVLTKRGDLIIEPFGGSGSTLIAAEKMKRRCFVMEKSAVYAEVIKKRWEKLTGQKGVLIND